MLSSLITQKIRMFIFLKSLRNLFQCSVKQFVVCRYTDCWNFYQISIEIRENGKSETRLFLIHMRKISSLYICSYKTKFTVYMPIQNLVHCTYRHTKLSSLYIYPQKTKLSSQCISPYKTKFTVYICPYKTKLTVYMPIQN